MQRNSVISLRPALGLWPMLRDLTGVDPDVAYGCVDWYVYHDAVLAARPSRGEPAIEPLPAASGPVAAGGPPTG